MHKEIALLLASSIHGISFSQTPWVTEVYQSYFNQCKVSMIQQGMNEHKANGVCYCMSSGFSKEFGMEQYNHLRASQPNPNGTVYDRKLYKVVTSCIK